MRSLFIHTELFVIDPGGGGKIHIFEECSGLINLAYSLNGTIYKKGNTLGNDTDQRIIRKAYCTSPFLASPSAGSKLYCEKLGWQFYLESKRIMSRNG